MRSWSSAASLTAGTAGAEDRCRGMRPVAAVDVYSSVIRDAGETSTGRTGPVEDPGDTACRNVDEGRGGRSISENRVRRSDRLRRSVEPGTVRDSGPHSCAAAVLVVLLPQQQILHAGDVQHVR